MNTHPTQHGHGGFHPHVHLEPGDFDELAHGRFRVVRTHDHRFFASVQVRTVLGDVHALIELGPHVAHAVAAHEAEHAAEQTHKQTVGFSFGHFLGGLTHTFGNMLKHVTAVATETVAPMFGLPPGAAGGLVELLMHAHAGHPDAKKRVAQLAKDPKYRGAMAQIARHLRAHPDFHAFRTQGPHLVHLERPHAKHATGCAQPQSTGGPVVRRQIVGYSHPVIGDEMTTGAAPIYGEEMTVGGAAPLYGEEMTVGFSFGDITKAIGHAASSVVHSIEKPIEKELSHIAAPVVKAVKGVADRIGHAIDAASKSAQHALSEAMRKAAQVIAKAHLGDMAAIKLIRKAVEGAKKGIKGLAHVADTFAKAAQWVAKNIDLPKILANAIPIPAVRRVAQSVIAMVDPNARFSESVEALRHGDFKKLKAMAQQDLSEAQGVISLIPGIGSGVSAALGAAEAMLNAGSPLDIAIRAAYGAIPIPIGIRNVTDYVLDAVLTLLHGGSITDAALAVIRDRVPSGLPRDVFDTLVNIIGKHQPIMKAAGHLAEHYVTQYTQGLGKALENGLAKAVAPAAQAVLHQLPAAEHMFASVAPHLKEITKVASDVQKGIKTAQHVYQQGKATVERLEHQVQHAIPHLPPGAHLPQLPHFQLPQLRGLAA